MMFIAIATFAAAAVSGTYANNSPQRKRTIENKYVTSNVIIEEKVDAVGDPYLGFDRNLEKDSSMSMGHEECVEDGGEVTMNMYIDGTDEQNDIEDLAEKCCSKSLSGSSSTSSISMGEDGVELPEGSYEGVCGVPDDDGTMAGESYCTYSPDKTCYETGWPACCKDEDTCPEERPECEIDDDIFFNEEEIYDKCADFDTLKAAEEACTEKHECGELSDYNFGDDCVANKYEHCTEINFCPDCEKEIRAMFDCEHGAKCGEGLGECDAEEVDTEGYWSQPGLYSGNKKKNGATSTISSAALSTVFLTFAVWVSI